jgi:hypothetical protein
MEVNRKRAPKTRKTADILEAFWLALRIALKT